MTCSGSALECDLKFYLANKLAIGSLTCLEALIYTGVNVVHHILVDNRSTWWTRKKRNCEEHKDVKMKINDRESHSEICLETRFTLEYSWRRFKCPNSEFLHRKVSWKYRIENAFLLIFSWFSWFLQIENI